MSKEELEKKSLAALLRIATAWYDQMKAGEIPSISLPTRTKYNIEFDDASEVWKYGDKESMRTAASAKSATHLLKMAYVIGFIKQQLKENRSSTLREMYYISEGWKRAKFGAQDESNFLIEDLEILSDVPREGFHLHPEENGASIYGPMRIREETRRGMKTIHCQDDVGQAGYTIPNNVENIEFVDHDAKFVIAIETGGMYDRLIENGFDEEHNAILVHLKGQPAVDPADAQQDQLELGPSRPGLHGWRPVVVPHLRLGGIRGDQERPHVRAARHAPCAVPRPAAERYPGLQPALRQADREGCRGPEIRAHRSPVRHGLLEKTDQPADRDEPEVGTAGICGTRAGLCDEEVFTGAAE